MIACTNHTDEQLFSRIAEGDQQAFRTFFFRYNVKVYYFILLIVERESQAAEVTQDVFLQLWLGRSELASVVNPGIYLFVIAKNRSLDQLEKPAARGALQHSFARQPKEFSGTLEQIFFSGQQ